MTKYLFMVSLLLVFISFVRGSYTFSEADGVGIIEVILVGQTSDAVTATVSEAAPGTFSFTLLCFCLSKDISYVLRWSQLYSDVSTKFT